VSYSFPAGVRLRIHIVSTRDRKPGFILSTRRAPDPALVYVQLARDLARSLVHDADLDPGRAGSQLVRRCAARRCQQLHLLDHRDKSDERHGNIRG
jgi:hypothetical protein